MKKQISIHKYVDYFHDGTLTSISQLARKIEISMSSAEVDLEDINSTILLSTDDRIKGKLHLDDVIKIKISNKQSVDDLFDSYDHGTILDFEIKNHKIELGIMWTNYYPKMPTNDFSIIEIETEKIWWENTPDL